MVVDFTSGTTIYPGPLCLTPDWWFGNSTHGPRYARSMARLTAVLRKMPLVGARDALLTLHGHGGLGVPPPPEPLDYVGMFRRTFAALEAVARPLNVTLHLRETGRNGVLRDTKSG